MKNRKVIIALNAISCILCTLAAILNYCVSSLTIISLLMAITALATFLTMILNIKAYKIETKKIDDEDF